MRISLNWLRELVDFDLEPEDLAQRLTLAGFEVEDIEDRRTWAEGVVLGKVLVREPHPNADKLSVCQVDIGADQPSTIVCGAANVAAGLWVPVATVGSFLPQVGEAGIKIRPAKLRGVLSEGMICSLAELGLAKESAGIHSFVAQIAPVGSDIRPLLGLDDVIFDLSSTANRADVLSMVGVAREVAALTGGKLHLPEVNTPTLSPAPSLKIAIDDPQTCPAYLGTLVENVTIAPSPQWLQSKLESAGVRPINNVVDITNYILLTWGQPLHAFDQDRLKTVAGGKALTIGVRLAKTGETLTTLDDQERSLQAQNLLITANDQPVALAGVMGGESTEVSDTTQNLLLEAALFSSIAVRRSGRAQGLRTEASTRYERGVNIAELEIACNHALQLLQELAGGKIVAQTVADSRNTQPRSIELRLERLQQVLGPVMPDLETEGESDLEDEFTGEFPSDAVPVCLNALGFGVTETESGQVWQVTVPPHRYRDIEREIDLIEEVARLYGYDNFAETLPAKTEYGYLPLDQTLTRQLREALRGAGLTELCHYSWTKPNPEDNSDGQISVVNPLLVEFSALRTELLTGLLQAYQYNREQGNGALNGFEIGRIFGEDENGLYEMDILAGIISGDPAQGRWLRHSLQDQPLTWYEAKGMLAGVFERLSLTVEFQPDSRNPRFHPGRTASLWVAGERLGTFGQIHPQLCQSLDLPAEIYLFQWDLEVVLASIEQAQAEQGIFKPFSTYPALDRDLAFFAGTQISVAELERTIWKAAGSSHSLLAGVELFDEYRGDSVPAGQRSLAFRLTYRTPDRTLTDAEVNPIQQQIRDALTEKYQVSLRS